MNILAERICVMRYRSFRKAKTSRLDWRTLPGLILAAGFLLFSTPTYGADLRLTQNGIAVEAGSLGAFTVSYPTFYNTAKNPVHKRIETQTQGNSATLRYEDGGRVDLAIGRGGEVTLRFASLPDDVKSFEMEMLIDLALSQGGTWKIGEATGSFPRAKPAKPHLFQGHAATFQLTNARGQSLALRTPDYAFQQLQDNREWNWPIFAWKFIAPYNPANPQATLTVSVAQAEGKAVKLVDHFGQSTSEDWPAKVKSLEELKADAESDQAYYASLQPPERDKFGGLPGSGRRLGLKKTGFFHVEQHNGKWWLVNPEGNAFFHLGVCVFNPNDDYTYVQGREEIYEWLPTLESEFKTAFRPGDGNTILSFHLVNLIRKFGQPYTLDTYVARMIERVRKWGFNSIGAFSSISETAARAANFPYVTHLPLNEWEGIPRIPGVRETFDPFDTTTRQRIQANLGGAVPARADDPLLIGWFIVNEPAYEDIPKVIPSLPGKHACKRQLTQMLREKYQTVAAFNTAWGMTAKSFDELNDVGLAVNTKAASEDVEAYTALFLDTYFSLVNTEYRKHDPNHLLLGSRLQPVTIKSQQLCRIAGKYVDVMSFNYYTYGVDKALLKQIYGWTGGRPMLLSEFFWSSPRDSGLVGGQEVGSQQQRGLAYRNYVEQSATLGFVVGIEWFTLVDQSVTGRWFSKYSGESSNSGLISVADRPWKPMLAEMMKTNDAIYEVLLGRKPPFVWDDPRFQPGKGN